MKYVKMLGLLAVAAAALMAFAGTASATLTDGSGNAITSLHAKQTGAVSLTGTLTITCQKSTTGGSVSTNDANHAEGAISTLTFEECGSSTVTVVNKGSLTATDAGASSTSATVYSKSAKVTVLVHNIFLGTIHCTYITSSAGTDIGSVAEGVGAKFTISASIERESATSDFGCGEHATWEGGYEVTTPSNLQID